MKAMLAVFAFVLCSSAAVAQDAVPIPQPKPVFVPGLYDSESRNSHFQGQPAKAQVCITSADFDSFQAETLQQYRANPQFTKTCTLGETKSTPDGFAFAMDCREAKTIVTFRFAKDLVAQTIETVIVRHKASSSSILTMMRRIGDCPAQKAPV
jgi:hypothetical protein